MSPLSFRVNPHYSLPECQGTPCSKQASYLFSFTVVGTPVGIASASISQMFLITFGIVKIFSKTMGKKKVTEKLL